MHFRIGRFFLGLLGTCANVSIPTFNTAYGCKRWPLNTFIFAEWCSSVEGSWQHWVGRIPA